MVKEQAVSISSLLMAAPLMLLSILLSLFKQFLVRPSGDAIIKYQETALGNTLRQQIFITVLCAALATWANDNNRICRGFDRNQYLV